MGVLNVTPDSFSDGGRWLDPEAAVAHGLEMVAAGAAVVDVGGESTRPGAEPVAEAEELRRVVPVVEALAPYVRVSVDTRKAVVAERAIAAGATLVNDVSASLHAVAAAGGVGWVAMHMQGDPRTMQQAPRYDDVVTEVRDFLLARAVAAERAGVDEVWIDPGIGFGKTFSHNLTLLKHLRVLAGTGHPVLVGTSRKSFLGKLTGGDVDDRFEGSLATSAWAMTEGASMVRVHDVRPAVQAARLVGDVEGDPKRSRGSHHERSAGVAT
jgi:dihydropteroate synthase